MSLRSIVVCSVTSIPVAAPTALTDAVVCPQLQIPQIRQVICGASSHRRPRKKDNVSTNVSDKNVSFTGREKSSESVEFRPHKGFVHDKAAWLVAPRQKMLLTNLRGALYGLPSVFISSYRLVKVYRL